MPASSVSIDNAEVVRVDTLGILCRVAGTYIFVAFPLVREGTTVKREGDVGRLVVPRWFAEDHGFAG
jgi:hypothetical protein